DSAGNRISDFSNVKTVEAFQAAPANFAFTNRSGLLCQFGWTSVAGTRYAIFIKPTGSTGQPVKIAGSETTNNSMSITVPFGSSDICVAAIDSAGNRISDFSNVKTVEAFQAAPTGFSITNRSGSTVQFGWTSVAGTRYAIYRRTAGTTDTPAKVSGTDTTSSTTSTTVTLTTLTGSYDYFVAIVDASGFRLSDFSYPAVTVTQ
ncbi:MAG TPA: peptidase M4, partial [Clostridia bacterium]